ncbi:MAG: hypothetical protein GQ564_18145 [Bacteroidales bacterium]|nr:hypothetical protein [Bacteroidales bacterium]
MKRKNYLLGIGLSVIIVVFFQCEMQERLDDLDSIDDSIESSSLLKGGSGDQEFGNNLSYPVIWSDGVTKVLRGDPGVEPMLLGEWWYCWGTEAAEPTDIALSCLPDPDNELFCDNGVAGTVDSTNVPGEDWLKAYIQKDASNVWQAGTADGSASPVIVDFIDWGDNLESVDWYTRSQVRTEVVLFKTLDPAMLEYTMRHVTGWGINEVHGLAVSQENAIIEGTGLQSTIYSGCARLTIQKLLVDREDPNLTNLVWVQNEGWTKDTTYVGELVNPPIFNLPVYEGEDGPGYYAAEINVKGKIIYGYTWNVKKLNDQIVNGGEAAGCYRITFSFDKNAPVQLNTFFEEGITEILVPLEEEEIATKSSDGEINGGATPVVDFNKNISYIDILIHERSGGGHR